MPALEAASDRRPRLLILGGTAEARLLAEKLERDSKESRSPPVRVITSLAGVTRTPAPVAGELRCGGFGGVQGLAGYLEANGIDFVIDATHPFARQISANAVDACEMAGVPRLVFSRPAWQPGSEDVWIEVDTFTEAAEVLPRFGRRIFVTTGHQGLQAFARLEQMWFLVRLVDPPETPLPLPACRVIAARGPFEVAEERRLLQAERIDALVCKASGGASGMAKLVAARAAKLPVVMIRRPPPPPGPLVTNLDDAIVAIRGALDVRCWADETPKS